MNRRVRYWRRLLRCTTDPALRTSDDRAVILRGIAGVLALVSVALFARRLGPDGYGWFGVLTAVAAISLGPPLQSIGTLARAREADAYDPTATIARVWAVTAGLMCGGAYLLPSDADPALAFGVVIIAAAVATLLIGARAWGGQRTANHASVMRAHPAAAALTAFGAALVHWVDRLFLVGHVSQADLGIYAAGVDLSRQFFVPLTWLLYIVWLPRLTAARTATATLQESAPDRTRIEMRYALAVMTLLLPALTVFILVRVELIAAVFGDVYAAQAGPLPWIAIAAVLGALRCAVLDTGLYREGRTQALLRNAAISAFVSVTLNALYVPRYGVMAAISAAVVSQSLAFFLAWHASRDIIAWRIPRVQFERIVFCWTAMVIGVLLLPTDVVLAARVGVAALVYAGALLLVNGAGIRDWVAARLRRVD